LVNPSGSPNLKSLASSITEIENLLLKIGINQNRETPLLFRETDFAVGFEEPMFPIRYVTVVEVRLQQMGDFYEKPHFTMGMSKNHFSAGLFIRASNCLGCHRSSVIIQPKTKLLTCTGWSLSVALLPFILLHNTTGSFQNHPLSSRKAMYF